MAGNFLKYSEVRESSEDGYLPRKVLDLKVDAESLIALAAPRPVFIGCGSQNAGDSWVDPYGLYISAQLASPAYELLGKQGVVMEDTETYNDQTYPYPTTNKGYIQGDIGFRMHSQGHTPNPNYPTFGKFISKYWS
jgi:hypothetical protein